MAKNLGGLAPQAPDTRRLCSAQRFFIFSYFFFFYFGSCGRLAGLTASFRAHVNIASLLTYLLGRGVLQAMWEKLAGKYAHRDQLIIC